MKAPGATTDTGGDSSDEDEDGSCCEADYSNNLEQHKSSGLMIDPVAEESQLKQQLLRKYSGIMICSLKKEFLKRKKKGKLPKEARQKLLDWWSQHYKWPYPSENEKAALADITGLNQKQINNWFINQRKRHWKPSEDLQYVMQLDAAHHHHQQHPQLSVDTAIINNNNSILSNSNNSHYDNANHNNVINFGASPSPAPNNINNLIATSNSATSAVSTPLYNILSFGPANNLIN